MLDSLWLQIVVYVLSYSYVFVSRYRSNRVEREKVAEIATQSIHKNLFNKKTNAIQISRKTL